MNYNPSEFPADNSEGLMNMVGHKNVSTIQDSSFIDIWRNRQKVGYNLYKSLILLALHQMKGYE